MEGLRQPIWLVCGGRNFTDRPFLYSALDLLISTRGKPARIIHGAARGADTLASQFALSRSIPVSDVPANWKRHGKSAGPIRNQEMLDVYKPVLVIAFPGGRGTEDMVKRAKVAGVEVVQHMNG